jgi:alkanesulfonate monooxygenase SsuD/methylene tetrahydromethanopterin reductase-like flavin-dependent oxidoreductase (luciferase family)
VARPAFDLVIHSFDITVRELADAAVAAEQAGFDAVFTYDHISATSFGGTRALDVWTALAAVALRTERVKLGPLVLNTTVRQPAHIAVAAATLQELSSGRLLLGLGAGAGPDDRFADELRMVGITPHDAAYRRQTVADTAGFLKALWSGQQHWRGEQFSLNTPTAIITADPVPRIIVGASGPKMAVVAGQVADAVNLHSWERDLSGLVALSRETAAKHQPSQNFEVTVEGPLGTDWIEPVLAVHPARVMIQWRASDGLHAIGKLGREVF